MGGGEMWPGGGVGSDESLPQRIVMAAYTKLGSPSPSAKLVTELEAKPLLSRSDIRELFTVLHRKAIAAQKGSGQWEQPHRPPPPAAVAAGPPPNQPLIAVALTAACAECEDETAGHAIDH